MVNCINLYVPDRKGEAMIIDVHYHLEERMETVEELLAQMSKHAIDRVALIPTLCDPVHLSRIAEAAGKMMPKMLMSTWRRLGLLLYNSTVTKDGKFSALGKLHTIYDSPDNESVAQVLNVYSEKFYGWIVVNPRVSDPILEVENTPFLASIRHCFT
jgi:hypothetical protein